MRRHRVADREHRQAGERRVGLDGDVSGTVDTHEQRLRPNAGDQSGGDQIGAFNQKGGLALTVLAYAQRGRPFDERVLTARDRGA